MKLSFSSLTQLCIAVFGALLTNTTISQAQITSDGTVNTQVNQNGNVAEITGGETRGNNLFHSFQDFSISNGGEAFFNNANSIANILSRVTGGNVSSINGLIRANGTANLFLINPAGIVFGEGSSLDLGGSFYGSTASSILFADGEFSAADLDNPPLLTVNAPIGLNFRDNPGDIALNPGSRLLISPTKILALVGGNINFDGGSIFPQDFSQPGITIELGGLTDAGTVSIGENGRLSFPNNVARGDIILTNNSIVGAFSTGEGAVFINAKNFELKSDTRIINALVSSPNAISTQSGDIVINATEDVVIDGENSEPVSIVNDVLTTSSGQAGKIEISGRNISLVNGGSISSTLANTTDGRSSDITLTAEDNITLRGTFSSIGNILIPGASGDAGEINITAKDFTIEQGAAIDSTSISTGNTSNININVSDTLSIDGRSSRIFSNILGGVGEFDATGNAGNINLQAQNLSISNDGRIEVSVSGQGDGGNIIIDADNIFVDGRNSEISSVTSQNIAGRDSQSAAGNITITTNSLAITKQAELSTSTASIGNAGDITITARDSVLVDGMGESEFELPSIISSDVELAIFSDVAGNSGNVEIVTPRLTVTNGGIISASTLADGNAGNLTIRASESIEVSNNAFIQADVFFDATGTGGNLNIETSRLTVSDGGTISASTFGNGNAGNLNLNVTDSINVTGESDTTISGLFAVALNRDGNGGELNVFTQDLTVSDNAVISVGNLPDAKSTRDTGTGEAGDLNIQANSINLESNGSINAATQSATGEGANINLQIAEDIILRDSGFISAQAIEEGNGGNLSIDSRFIVAFPDGNNDILASAEQGQGGNITINAESLFGIQERSLNNASNDINASSQVSGLDGSISINTPDLNPVRGATELPSNVIETGETTVQACNANREAAAKNGLTIKGKGGIVPAPELPLNAQNILIEGETSTPISSLSQYQAVSTSYGAIVPARGVEVAENGQVILTAYAVDNNQRGYNGSLNCGLIER